MNVKLFTRRKLWAALITLAISSLGASAIHAQAYPDKPIRVVMPFPPGNSGDLLARAISKQLADQMGQPVVVDNKPGNTGHVGGDLVAKSKGDGYTLLVTVSSAVTVSPNLLKNLPYDTTTDLVPIGIIALIPSVLVASSSQPYATIEELVAYGKAHPNTLSFASYGIGSNLHLAGEQLKGKGNFTAQHIPYNASQLMPDLLSGRVSFMYDSASTVLPYIKSGRLKALAVSSEDPLLSLPGIPPVGKAYPGLSFNAWVGMFAPRGTPPAVLAKLESEFRKALKGDEMQRILRDQEMKSTDMNAAQTAVYIRAERARWGHIVQETGVKLD